MKLSFRFRIIPNLTATAANRGLGQALGPNMLPQNNLDTTNLTQKLIHWQILYMVAHIQPKISRL